MRIRVLRWAIEGGPRLAYDRSRNHSNNLSFRTPFARSSTRNHAPESSAPKKDAGKKDSGAKKPGGGGGKAATKGTGILPGEYRPGECV